MLLREALDAFDSKGFRDKFATNYSNLFNFKDFTVSPFDLPRRASSPVTDLPGIPGDLKSHPKRMGIIPRFCSASLEYVCVCLLQPKLEIWMTGHCQVYLRSYCGFVCQKWSWEPPKSGLEECASFSNMTSTNFCVCEGHQEAEATVEVFECGVVLALGCSEATRRSKRPPFCNCGRGVGWDSASITSCQGMETIQIAKTIWRWMPACEVTLIERILFTFQAQSKAKVQAPQMLKVCTVCIHVLQASSSRHLLQLLI